MQRKTVYRLVLSSMFFALGIVLPFLTGQIPEIGNMLLPMHIPVLICGLVCGWQYGAVVGFCLPITRSLIFSMPVLFPRAVAMAFELSAYGCLIGLFFLLFRKRTVITLYVSLILSMIGGRIVWGGVMAVLISFFMSGRFLFKTFLTEAVITAIPGIILQLILIPSLMLVLDRTHLVPWRTRQRTESSLKNKSKEEKEV